MNQIGERGRALARQQTRGPKYVRKGIWARGDYGFLGFHCWKSPDFSHVWGHILNGHPKSAGLFLGKSEQTAVLLHF